jgi:hypothetical protein
MPTAKIIVGYRTRPVAEELLKSIMPVIQANKSFKEEAKIAADIATKTEAFMSDCKDYGYTGTFDEVVLMTPNSEKVTRFEYKGREPGGKRSPICLAVASWINKAFPGAWSDEAAAKDDYPTVVFLGFNMRQFLKMLGTECSLPEHAKPLPHRMWIGNSDHRDIEELILPKDFEPVTLASALKRRRPKDDESAAQWDKFLTNWPGPHVDPTTDVWLITELANQIGYLAD